MTRMTDRRCLLFVGVLVLTGAAVASAQQRQIGLKAGVSLATLEPRADAVAPGSYDVRTGLTGGVYAVFPVHRRLALQIEALFTEKGGTQPLDDPRIIQGTVAERLRFQYLDLPVLARLTGPRIGSASLHAFGGPSFGIRTSASYQTAFAGAGDFGIEYDIASEVRRFDMALSAGLGADIGSRLVIDGRYSWGLRDVVDGSVVSRVRNRGFLITTGMRIF
jgi:hypothetical protein